MRIQRDENGQATVFTAVVMGIVMIGFLAFALDLGYLFHEKRMAQAAADAAAVAAAEELTTDSANTLSSPSVMNAANVAATLNGFNTSAASNPAHVYLSTPTTQYYSTEASAPEPTNWVQANVTQPVHTFFLGAFNSGMRTISVSATAVAAGVSSSPACICLKGTTGTDLNMSNDAQLNAGACNITADSSSSNAITIVGSAGVCAKKLAAVATNWDNGSNINNGGGTCTGTTPVQGALPCNMTLPVPTQPAALNGHCTDNPVGIGYDLAGNAVNPNNYNADYTLPFKGAQKMSGGNKVAITDDTVVTNAGITTVCYSSFNLSPAHSVTFPPNTVVFVNGDFTTGGGETITGTNVQFIISGNLYIQNGPTINLDAPIVSGEPGVLFYVLGNTLSIQGGANSVFSGIIYAPTANANIANGTGTTANMDIVANTLTMAGGAALTSYATPVLGGGSGGTGGPAKLVQ